MRDERRNHEKGIALVLALLSLMLLTFLGLALAATTSTELQIANNYRWSQQAFYNAEAGLEVAKVVLAGTNDWGAVLPPGRTVPTWVPDRSNVESFTASAHRDYENAACDFQGNGVGYGRVLDDGSTVYEDVHTVSALGGLTLRGAFTIWVRRVVVPQDVLPSDSRHGLTGLFTDDEGDENIVVTAEGVAPFTNTAAGQFAQQHQAVRVVEASFRRGIESDDCDFMDPEGAGFAKCFPGEDGGVGFTGDSSIR